MVNCSEIAALRLPKDLINSKPFTHSRNRADPAITHASPSRGTAAGCGMQRGSGRKRGPWRVRTGHPITRVRPPGNHGGSRSPQTHYRPTRKCSCISGIGQAGCYLPSEGRSHETLPSHRSSGGRAVRTMAAKAATPVPRASSADQRFRARATYSH